MARLIDADALPYSRVRIFYGLMDDGTPIVGGFNAVVMSCAIREAPTVDAAPVVHGRWLPTSDPDKKRCSECDVIHLIAQYPHGQANYCPNCGAKMDGGDVDGI